MSLEHQEPWQSTLKNAITNINELCSVLDLDPATLLLDNQSAFSLKIPHSLIARMEKGNPSDPLLLQVLPLAQESLKAPGFTKDPLQEKRFNPVPGLLHKYHGRVLVTLSGTCALHCRFCFRRHYPYEENVPSKKQFTEIIQYIKARPEINEVILSGGDPLTIKDSYLESISEQLQAIPHLTTWRFHTRFLMAIPERATDKLAHILQNTRLRSVLIVHSNHPNELDNSLENHFKKLRNSNITLLNHSVLLKNINDSADTLSKLSQRLFEIGILPYYLNILDPVEGASHFLVAIEEAKAIIKELMKRLPGYLVPTLAQEIPGEDSKIPVPLFT